MQQVNLEAKTIRPLVLVDLDWFSGHVRAHSGVGNVEFMGQTYQGIGALGNISTVKESGEISPHTLTVTLVGIDQALFSEVLNDKSVGRPATIYLALLNEDSTVLDSELLFKGRIGSPSISVGDNNVVSVKLVSRLEVWDKQKGDRYTNQSHQKRKPNDDFFRFVAELVDYPIYWGNKKDAVPLKGSII